MPQAHPWVLSCLQVYLFAEALAEGAVKMGMPGALASRIAAQTLLVSPWHTLALLPSPPAPGLHNIHRDEGGGAGCSPASVSPLGSKNKATRRAKGMVVGHSLAMGVLGWQCHPTVGRGIWEVPNLTFLVSWCPIRVQRRCCWRRGSTLRSCGGTSARLGAPQSTPCTSWRRERSGPPSWMPWRRPPTGRVTWPRTSGRAPSGTGGVMGTKASSSEE